MAPPPLSDSELHALYVWIDEIPLSRPKRNIARDFSDGVCVAEVVKHYFPKFVDLHNYTATLASNHKRTNWETLNARVFRKVFGFQVTKEEINDIIVAVPGAIEHFLRSLQTKIAQLRQRRMTFDDDGVSYDVTNAPQVDDKDQMIAELTNSVRLLTRKVKQLEELVRLRDEKIASMQQKMH
jgi:hypothetical protein